MAILRWKIQFSNKINPWRHFKIDSGSKFFCNAIKKKNTLEISSQAKSKIRNLWSLREREGKMEIAHSMGKFNSKSFWAVNQKNGLENHINFFNLNGKCWLFSWNHEKNFVIDPNLVRLSLKITNIHLPFWCVLLTNCLFLSILFDECCFDMKRMRLVWQ